MKPPSTTTIYSSVTSTPFLPPRPIPSLTVASCTSQKNIKKKKKMEKASSILWDCDSSLYDSYELKSFKQQLDSAINSRTLSMPHLPHRPPPPPEHHPPKTSGKFSRSLSKFFRSLFRRKPKSKAAPELKESYCDNIIGESEDFCDRSGSSLWTIPEAPETSLELSPPSPEFNSVARRAVSDRFSTFSVIHHRF